MTKSIIKELGKQTPPTVGVGREREFAEQSPRLSHSLSHTHTPALLALLTLQSLRFFSSGLIVTLHMIFYLSFSFIVCLVG